jgi:hypothetical protein
MQEDIGILKDICARETMYLLQINMQIRNDFLVNRGRHTFNLESNILCKNNRQDILV